MNTMREEANLKFVAFFNQVDSTIISESAKSEFIQAPTQWHRLVEVMLIDESERLDEKDARPMFRRIFTNFHEKISVRTSLSAFVDWLKTEGMRIDETEGRLTLIPGDGKDGYDALDAFADKFSW